MPNEKFMKNPFEISTSYSIKRASFIPIEKEKIIHEVKGEKFTSDDPREKNVKIKFH